MVIMQFRMIIVCCVLISESLALKTFAAAVPVRRTKIVRPCKVPSLPNGTLKIRNGGRIVTFTCAAGYELVGNVNGLCENQRWNIPVPVCVKSGCEQIDHPEHSFITYSHHHGIVKLLCESQWEPAGASIAYCNGTDWSNKLGKCRMINRESALTCDFETETICDWKNDDELSHKWQRLVGGTEFLVKGKRRGPSVDHTHRKPLIGHFMAAIGDLMRPGNVARIYSPIYQLNNVVTTLATTASQAKQQNGATLTNANKNVCFEFAYYMYAVSTCTLSIGLRKMVSVNDSAVNAKRNEHLSSSYNENVKDTDDDQLLNRYIYNLTGSQGDEWHENIVPLNFNEVDFTNSISFQIVIEANGITGVGGELAIDDVTLMYGNDCADTDLVLATEDYKQIDEDDRKMTLPIMSCANRCNEIVSQKEQQLPELSSFNELSPSAIVADGCDCHEQCLSLVSCCPDYLLQCIDNLPIESETESNGDSLYGMGSQPSSSSNATITKNIPSSTFKSITKQAETNSANNNDDYAEIDEQQRNVNPRVSTTLHEYGYDRLNLDANNRIYASNNETRTSEFEANATHGRYRTAIIVATLFACVSIIGCVIKVNFSRKTMPEALSSSSSAQMNIVNRSKSLLGVVFDRSSRRCRRSDFEKSDEEFSDCRYLTSHQQIDFTLATPSTITRAHH